MATPAERCGVFADLAAFGNRGAIIAVALERRRLTGESLLDSLCSVLAALNSIPKGDSGPQPIDAHE